MINKCNSVKHSCTLPLQLMPGESAIEVFRFGSFEHDTSYEPHRHQYDIALWATKGSGSHKIDFKEYDIYPGRFFFIRQGQVHQVKQYSEEGWMILIKKLPVHNHFYGQSCIELGGDTSDTCRGLFGLLQAEILHGKELRIIESLLSALLVCLETREHPSARPYEMNLVNDLQFLIDRYFRTEKNPSFYSDELGVDHRKLNVISKDVLGKSIHLLLQEKLLDESKALLATSRLTVKEITFALGFEDPSYFCRHFKKATGMAPLQYRKQVQDTGN